jgi:hypothetical protein
VDTAFLDRVRRAALAGIPGEPVAFAYLFSSRATDGARVDSGTDRRPLIMMVPASVGSR